MRPSLSSEPGHSRPCRHETTDPRQQAQPAFARRGLLALAGVAFLSLGSRIGAPAHAGPNDDNAILQPATPDKTAFMQRAFEMRQYALDKGDQAYGAVIVRDGSIVGQSWSRVILDQDPTAHAETAAIRDAAKRLRNRDLGGAVLYSSSRPCPMCEAAAYWAGIGQLVYGRGLTDGGAPKLCG